MRVIMFLSIISLKFLLFGWMKEGKIMTEAANHQFDDSSAYKDFKFITTWGGNFQRAFNSDPDTWEPSLRDLCSSSFSNTAPALKYHAIFIYGVNAHFGAEGLPGMDLSTHCEEKQTNLDISTSPNKSSLLYCPSVGRDIKYCQSKGIKIFITIANVLKPLLTSNKDGEKLAVNIWNLFLGGSHQLRPFGKGVVLDGVDLFIRDGIAGYLGFAKKMRQLINKSKKNSSAGRKSENKDFFISVSPRCSFPDGNAGPVFKNSVLTRPELFDSISLFAMSSPDCTFRNEEIFWSSLQKWSDWKRQIASPANNNNTQDGVSMYLGLPAADNGISAPEDYISVKKLIKDEFAKKFSAFKGSFDGVHFFDSSVDNANEPCEENELKYSQIFYALLMNNKKIFSPKDKCTPPSSSDDQDTNSPTEKRKYKGKKDIYDQMVSAAVGAFGVKFCYFLLLIGICIIF